VPDAKTRSLEALAEEIFDLTTLSWRARSRQRSKSGADLGETEFLALDLLVRKEPRSVGELQRSIGILPAQMSRVIRSLEGKHGRSLIQCGINPTDKRRIDVRATDAGRRAHRTYRAARVQTTVSVLGRLRERDRTEFMRLLRLIRGLLAQQLP